jgi:hypothetical protein
VSRRGLTVDCSSSCWDDTDPVPFEQWLMHKPLCWKVKREGKLLNSNVHVKTMRVRETARAHGLYSRLRLIPVVNSKHNYNGIVNAALHVRGPGCCDTAAVFPLGHNHHVGTTLTTL